MSKLPETWQEQRTWIHANIGYTVTKFLSETGYLTVFENQNGACHVSPASDRMWYITAFDTTGPASITRLFNQLVNLPEHADHLYVEKDGLENFHVVIDPETAKLKMYTGPKVPEVA